MRSTAGGQRGLALASALLILTLVFGIAGAYFTLSIGGYDNSTRELASAQARLGAEDGIHLSIAELKSGVDAGGNGLGNLVETAADGRTVTVTATNLGPTSYVGSFLYQIHSVAQLQRSQSAADLVAEIIPPQPISYQARATITARGPVATTGNITIDGRDWNYAGTAVVGPGTYGISTLATVTNGGSSQVGGSGISPSSPPPPGSQEPGAGWADAIDQDGDGSVDEEAFDGIDNDDDGQIDEDTNSYPTDPDVAVHVPFGTLKDAAIATNTYFTNQAQFDAMVAANGNKTPGGKVIYCDFPLWEPATFGSQFNHPPSVIVHHNASSTAVMKNVHGRFRGLLLADSIGHLNGDFIIMGALMTFSAAPGANAFGNGSAQIRLSTAVLANLPIVGKTRVKIRSWSRATPQ